MLQTSPIPLFEAAVLVRGCFAHHRDGQEMNKKYNSDQNTHTYICILILLQYLECSARHLESLSRPQRPPHRGVLSASSASPAACSTRCGGTHTRHLPPSWWYGSRAVLCAVCVYIGIVLERKTQSCGVDAIFECYSSSVTMR